MFRPLTTDEIKNAKMTIIEHVICSEASSRDGNRSITFMKDLARNREWFKIVSKRTGLAMIEDYANNIDDAIEIYNQL